MQTSAELDELDRMLVTALQAAPRADWRRVGRALDVDASTAARRWARLTEAGLARLSCHPSVGPGLAPLVAFIEIDCAPGLLRQVAARIAADSHVFTVEHVTGARDLLVTAAFQDQAALARYLGFRLGALEGVAATRSQIATMVHVEGSHWRLDRLPERRRALLLDRAPAERSAGAAAAGTPDTADLALFTALSEDCRMPAAGLAERTGLSPTTVRRRLARMQADRALVFRCEVARFLSGWPVSVTLWCAAPPGDVPKIAAQLIGTRETRLCASLSGPHNVMATVWLRSVEDIQAYEARLVARFPELVIADRAIALWPLKLGGHILDPYGRHVRAVPVALWEDSAAATAEESLLAPFRPAGGGGPAAQRGV
ncbi:MULTISPECIES: Lrp/AsnC family transcriptional regulator [unclassified Streptomyces]|uniref:Lrp/AsnC family transcriptional regulator n=1 Tax=unclassified Streptomyces TaxID=2593676 RepID=UPI0035DAB7F2